MRKSYLAVIGFVMLLSFQNCGKPPGNGSSSSETPATISEAPAFNKLSIQSYTTLAVWDYLRSQYLDVNLQTGEMISFAEAGQIRGLTYCVAPARMDELRKILSAAEICEPLVRTSEVPGQVCTMQYRYPYASLVEKTGEMRLGEKTSGCDIPIDLCGEKAVLLKNWTKVIVSNLDLNLCK